MAALPEFPALPAWPAVAAAAASAANSLSAERPPHPSPLPSLRAVMLRAPSCAGTAGRRAPARAAPTSGAAPTSPVAAPRRGQPPPANVGATVVAYLLHIWILGPVAPLTGQYSRGGLNCLAARPLGGYFSFVYLSFLLLSLFWRLFDLYDRSVDRPRPFTV